MSTPSQLGLGIALAVAFGLYCCPNLFWPNAQSGESLTPPISGQSITDTVVADNEVANTFVADNVVADADVTETIVADNLVTIDINTSNGIFPMSYNPNDADAAVKAAGVFCKEHRARFQLDEEWETNCVVPISEYVASMNRDAAEPEPPVVNEELPTISISIGPEDKHNEEKFEMEVNGQMYVLFFNPRAVTSAQVSASFCKYYKDSFGISTDEGLGQCVEALVSHVDGLVNGWVMKQQAEQDSESAQPQASSGANGEEEFELTVNGIRLGLTFDPSAVTTLEAASSFCNKHSETLQVDSQDYFDDCVRKVAPHFDAFIHPTETSGEAVRPKTSVEQTEDPSLLVLSPAEHSDSANNSEFQFTINGVNFRLQFDPLMIPTSQAASVYCEHYRDTFGITTVPLMSECANSVSLHLEKSVLEWKLKGAERYSGESEVPDSHSTTV